MLIVSSLVISIEYVLLYLMYLYSLKGLWFYDIYDFIIKMIFKDKNLSQLIRQWN